MGVVEVVRAMVGRWWGRARVGVRRMGRRAQRDIVLYCFFLGFWVVLADGREGR